MKDRTISLRQLMTVLFLALFPLGTEQLPGRLSAVGAAAWLCPILAGASLWRWWRCWGEAPSWGREIWGSGLPRDGDRGRDGFWRASFSFGVST
ncbi:MAG: hypothetical protein ACLR1T_12290 [Evtepia gabavorous]